MDRKFLGYGHDPDIVGACSNQTLFFEGGGGNFYVSGSEGKGSNELKRGGGRFRKNFLPPENFEDIFFFSDNSVPFPNVMSSVTSYNFIKRIFVGYRTF